MSGSSDRHHDLMTGPGAPEPGGDGAGPGPMRSSMDLPAELTRLREARAWAVAFMCRHCPDSGMDSVSDLRMVVDELACNALRHARAPYRLALTLHQDRLLIEVSDTSTEPAQPRDAYQDGGRGLTLIDAIATRWGQEPRTEGKTVWAELPVRPGDDHG
ncbi:ATP-binding protein [Amycolatopsis sp. PS_44_ISF1]|uniref:ATP-binding protein n=1 Tax=Amycolatopsis sp. PS_44_ISF1 TaxID=2974917 RepID=UPI0028DEE7BD|nr:ATP-binding protein [Amycolatopsis sp. PS_44_ISF1]MDT8915176.1 ATP-binding protein [Amycolatopsis sp. PS_44_ISF1]